MTFFCIDCHTSLTFQTETALVCSQCRRVFQKENGVWRMWPKSMSELAKEEVAFHDGWDEDAEDVHQLNAWRNEFYHRELWHAIQALPKGSGLLELGAGSGHDARRFVGEYRVTVSDVSPKTVERLLTRVPLQPANAVALDAERLPFEKEQFAGVYAVAMWHHLTKPKVMIDECVRVLVPGGLLVIAMEPNATYFRPIQRLRPLLLRATHTDVHDISHADAEMTGFTKKGIEKCFDRAVWSSVTVRPAWLFAGWLHYFLEFLFRGLRLKKRIRAPLFFEKMIVQLDELLFKIPGVKHLAWHWIVTAIKTSKHENMKTA